jgi:hypothetical protein
MLKKDGSGSSGFDSFLGSLTSPLKSSGSSPSKDKTPGNIISPGREQGESLQSPDKITLIGKQLWAARRKEWIGVIL